MRETLKKRRTENEGKEKKKEKEIVEKKDWKKRQKKL